MARGDDEEFIDLARRLGLAGSDDPTTEGRAEAGPGTSDSVRALRRAQRSHRRRRRARATVATLVVLLVIAALVAYLLVTLRR